MKEAEIGNGKSKEMTVLIRVYEWINAHFIMIRIPIIVIIMSIVADLCPWPYVQGAEKIFSRCQNDYSTLGTAVLVIWTFTVSLIIFFLGHLDDKKYGISITDVVLTDFPHNVLFKMLFVFLLELVSLFWAVAYKKEILLTISVGLQISTMIYVFVMVCIERSQEHIQETVKKQSKNVLQGKDGKSWMLAKLLTNTDYNDDIELDLMIGILIDIVDKDEGDNVQKFLAEYICYVLKGTENEVILTRIIGNLLTGIKSISAKKGIMQSILDEAYSLGLVALMDVCNIEFDGRREVVVWGIAYNAYYAGKEKQQYRYFLSEKMWQSLGKQLSDDEEEEILLIRGKLSKKEKNGEEQEGELKE